MRVLVVGATSDIGSAVAAEFAARHGAALELTGRDSARLARVVADLRTRFGVEARGYSLDVVDTTAVAAFWRNLEPRPDGVVYAVGVFGEQSALQADFDAVRAQLAANYLGAVAILEPAAAEFAARGAGFIVGISSVAGERGRASNYLYGASKAALTTFLSGLRNRLQGSGVHVVTVLPGFVATRMTAHLDLPRALTAAPEEVAVALVDAVRRRRRVVYMRGIWRIVMAAIRALPEWLFVRTRL